VHFPIIIILNDQRMASISLHTLDRFYGRDQTQNCLTGSPDWTQWNRWNGFIQGIPNMLVATGCLQIPPSSSMLALKH